MHVYWSLPDFNYFCYMLLLLLYLNFIVYRSVFYQITLAIYYFYYLERNNFCVCVILVINYYKHFVICFLGILVARNL